MKDKTEFQCNIPFEDLIHQYKKDYFQRIEVIDHQFLYCCFAPPPLTDEILCLERNILPSGKYWLDLEKGD